MSRKISYDYVPIPRELIGVLKPSELAVWTAIASHAYQNNLSPSRSDFGTTRGTTTTPSSGKRGAAPPWLPAFRWAEQGSNL